VIVDHGLGVTSLYIHLSAIEVQAGQSVAKGELLGRVGSTGVSTGPHLHWSVYVQGEAISPAFFMRLSKRGIEG
jgi:murein DD-endopeptidase MepM/ murein hydrolase activator NlpD